AGKIRDAVKPLMAQLKRLLPAQRERATELMYQADELEGAVQAMLAKKDTMLKEASPAEDPFLFVATVIHSGVTIIIGDRMTTFTKELHGPVKIMRRRVNRVLEMVAVNDLSGGVTVLHSREFVPEPA
ncbi:MAG: hypothetical protein JXA69_16800, partial [Phycisphaerae bacterium]|nr:hypothetical protein [Phycisphaerae bacterium]